MTFVFVVSTGNQKMLKIPTKLGQSNIDTASLIELPKSEPMPKRPRFFIVKFHSKLVGIDIKSPLTWAKSDSEVMY